jgi:hypothetical protein
MIAQTQCKLSRSSQPVQLSSFSRLVDETENRISLNASRVPCDLNYANRLSLNSKFHLTAYEWVMSANGFCIANSRMVHIVGAKNEIINTRIFPRFPQYLPVFAAELIGVGGVIKVAFVDIQTPAVNTLHANKWQEISKPLGRRFQSLPRDEDPPHWATADSQGHYTYGRNVPPTRFAEVEACYLSYLDSYLKNILSDWHVQNDAMPQIDLNSLNVLHTYQHHHMEHSPGKKFLGTLFGTDWTDSFMKNFLFSLPRG